MYKEVNHRNVIDVKLKQKRVALKHRCMNNMALKHGYMVGVTYQINGVRPSVPNRFVVPHRHPKAFFLLPGQIKNNMNICV